MVIIKQSSFSFFLVVVDEADFRCTLTFLNHSFLAHVTRVWHSDMCVLPTMWYNVILDLSKSVFE